MPTDHLELFREYIVAAEGYNQSIDNDMSDTSDSDEEDFNMEATYYKADGSEFTLSDMPFKSLASLIECHIQMYIPEPRRTEVYKKVVEGIHGIKKSPRWDRHEDNPRAEPRTAFSESKAVSFR